MKDAIWTDEPIGKSFCCSHNKECTVSQVHIDIGGSPCPDYSRMGIHQGKNGPASAVLLTWLKIHKANQRQ